MWAYSMRGVAVGIVSEAISVRSFLLARFLLEILK